MENDPVNDLPSTPMPPPVAWPRMACVPIDVEFEIPCIPMPFGDVPKTPMPRVDLPSTPASNLPFVDASVPKRPAANFVADVLANAVDAVRPVPPVLVELRPGPVSAFVSVAHGDALEQLRLGTADRSDARAAASRLDATTAPPIAKKPIAIARTTPLKTPRRDMTSSTLQTIS